MLFGRRADLSLVETVARPAGRLRRLPANLPILAVALVVTALSLIPLGFIVFIGIDSGWETVAKLVFRPRVGELLINTFFLELVTLPIAIVLSVGLAFLVERTDLRFARLWSWLLVAPLAIPAFVQSYAWNSFASGLNGFWGAVLVSILAYFPFLYLPVAAQLRRLDPTLEETAASLGLRPTAIFLRVILPQLRPALVINSVYALIQFLKTFTVVVVMTKGGPSDQTNFVTYLETVADTHNCRKCDLTIKTRVWNSGVVIKFRSPIVVYCDR